MGTVAVEQRNNEYILRPLSWFGRGRTRTQSKICGYIARYARNGKSYTVGYNDIQEQLNTSRSSIWRGITKEKADNAFVIERDGGKENSYTYVGEWKKEFSVRTELYFYTEMFGKGIDKRYLTDSEVDVLSLIYTWTTYRETLKYTGNYNDIAKTLGLDYYTVYRAIYSLMKLHLIVRLHKGTSNANKGEYKANMKVLTVSEKLTRKKEQSKPKQVQEQDKKADLQRKEQLLSETAWKRAEGCLARAKSLPRFKEIAGRLGKLNIEMANAELYAPLTLPALTTERNELLKERADILRELGMQEWELDKDEQYKRLIAESHRPKDGGA